jgi:hypothetical protein
MLTLYSLSAGLSVAKVDFNPHDQTLKKGQKLGIELSLGAVTE